MSTTAIMPVADMQGREEYITLGRGLKRHENLENGTTRIAAEFSDVPWGTFGEYCAARRLANPRRKLDGYELRISFDRNEIDPDKPEDTARAMDYAYRLVHEVAPNSACRLVAHKDGEGGCFHVHAEICNEDMVTGKALSHGLNHKRVVAINNRLSAEYGFHYMETAQKGAMWPEERAKHDAFEQMLGDRAYEALQKSLNVDDYKNNLSLMGVELVEKSKTLKDGSVATSWTYRAYDYSCPKPRKRRRNAKKLSDDLTKKSVDQYFVQKQNQEQVVVQPVVPNNDIDTDDCEFFEQFQVNEADVSEIADDLIAAKRREDMQAGRRIDTSSYDAVKANAKPDTAKLMAELNAARTAFMQAQANRDALRQSGGQFFALSKCFTSVARSLMRQTRNPLACVALSFGIRMAEHAKQQRQLERQRQIKVAAQELYKARGNLWTAEKAARAAGLSIQQVHSRPANQRANALMEKGEQLEKELALQRARERERQLSR